ncbi:hypothetical protein [Mycobacterium xenopi]|uniref:Uncharacterized protein n=1 Tax=Mycobacterium xenopi TaxID=1789 RepID=A0AAD1GY10_MYCXE|nr:hypothetical protein [Mycobacterium xenopi]MDA3640532.1 hypothetical protein [Mycobacterium xenopi]MDA3657980.1 hypothetical protein [Mycobacterium xenopi]MDA3662638.1 hypothetical protein [Mycobacterium xenopi]SPX78897.1 Uncharacterised protein [Mycobacterium xenopi]BBU21207.1 hypothetical protein MYXE_09960 [Mycobacterium xenopi]
MPGPFADWRLRHGGQDEGPRLRLPGPAGGPATVFELTESTDATVVKLVRDAAG